MSAFRPTCENPSSCPATPGYRCPAGDRRRRGLWDSPAHGAHRPRRTHPVLVAGTRPHPFGYFGGDWGLGNHGYRPLFSATQWLVFQLFGVWALPYQLLSLGLHLVVIALLFELISHVARHDVPALRLLLALGALVSPYTVSGASWIADRPTLMVALSLLLLIRHLYVGGARPRPWIVGGLSGGEAIGGERLGQLRQPRGSERPRLRADWRTLDRPRDCPRGRTDVHQVMRAGQSAG